jgi:hypothetical protein
MKGGTHFISEQQELPGNQSDEETHNHHLSNAYNDDFSHNHPNHDIDSISQLSYGAAHSNTNIINTVERNKRDRLKQLAAPHVLMQE